MIESHRRYPFLVTISLAHLHLLPLYNINRIIIMLCLDCPRWLQSRPTLLPTFGMYSREVVISRARK